MSVASPARAIPSGTASCQSTQPSWPKCTTTCHGVPAGSVTATSIILAIRVTPPRGIRRARGAGSPAFSIFPSAMSKPRISRPARVRGEEGCELVDLRRLRHPELSSWSGAKCGMGVGRSARLASRRLLVGGRPSVASGARGALSVVAALCCALCGPLRNRRPVTVARSEPDDVGLAGGVRGAEPKDSGIADLRVVLHARRGAPDDDAPVRGVVFSVDLEGRGRAGSRCRAPSPRARTGRTATRCGRCSSGGRRRARRPDRSPRGARG